MDDILKQILNELKAQGQRLERLETGQDELRQGQDRLRQDQKALIARMGNFEQGQEALIERVGNLEQGQAELRQGQQALIGRVGKLEQGQQKTDEKLTKLAIHVEGEITDKIRGLYDTRDLVLESLARIEQRQERQDERLDQHWQEIMLLKNKRR